MSNELFFQQLEERHLNVIQSRERDITESEIQNIGIVIYGELVCYNSVSPARIHNLQVLFLAYPDIAHRECFFLHIQEAEPDFLKFLFQHCDCRNHKGTLFKRLVTAINSQREDTFDVLIEALGTHLSEGDFRYLLAISARKRSLSMFRTLLRHIEAFCEKNEKKMSEVISDAMLNFCLAGSPVEFFDELYLLGFNVFVAHQYKYLTEEPIDFVETTALFKNEEVFMRLIDLKLVPDSYFHETPKDIRKRSHYRFMLLINERVNDRSNEDVKDVVLRSYLTSLATPLSAIRALSREWYIHNSNPYNKRYSRHTIEYLESLRPECNEELAATLRQRRQEKRRERKKRRPLLLKV